VRPTALLLACALAAAGSAGCETFAPNQCDTSLAGNPAVTYCGGQVQDGVYMSSPWGGDLLYFPGGMHYSLVHGLGAAPTWIQTYLSFDRAGGSLAQSAGNQVEIVGVDASTIQVANDSCTAYWLLVVAGGGAGPDGGAPSGTSASCADGGSP
jgi:hypothetical protein